MIDRGRFPILGVNVSAIDYEAATARVVAAAEQRQPLAVSALAVHGVMVARDDETMRRRINGLDIVTPDGQPVRWALGWLHGERLPDRVYGPNLMLAVLRAAAERGLSVYLYGSQPSTLLALRARLQATIPGLEIAGAQPSFFRRLTPEEQAEVRRSIRESGASIVFVGLGCPRQEVWAFENARALGLPVLAVGAAYDFHAGTVPQAPSYLQKRGLEWLFRLIQEPRRLWRRYLILNPRYLWNVGKQLTRISTVEALGPTGNEPLERYG